MKITAQTRLKHTGLLDALRQLGWTNIKLAERTGISPSLIGMVINLKTRPSEKTAQKIEFALGEEDIYLKVLEEWPTSFKGFKKTFIIEQTKNVDITRMIENESPLMLPPVQEDSIDYEWLHEQVAKLPQHHQDILNKVYFGSMTTREYAESINRTQQATAANLDTAINALLKQCGSSRRVNRGVTWKDNYTRTRNMIFNNVRDIEPLSDVNLEQSLTVREGVGAESEEDKSYYMYQPENAYDDYHGRIAIERIRKLNVAKLIAEARAENQQIELRREVRRKEANRKARGEFNMWRKKQQMKPVDAILKCTSVILSTKKRKYTLEEDREYYNTATSFNVRCNKIIIFDQVHHYDIDRIVAITNMFPGLVRTIVNTARDRTGMELI